MIPSSNRHTGTRHTHTHEQGPEVDDIDLMKTS